MMSEASGQKVRLKFELEIDGVQDDMHGRLMEVHKETDLTKMVQEILAADDEGPMYTKIIWGQWQQLA
jgi:hypothetical protein